jgi:hypothetical protein
MSRPLAVLALLSLAACSSPDPPRPAPAAEEGRLAASWTVSDEFTPEEAEAALDAIGSWRDATGGRADPCVSVGPVAAGDRFSVRPVPSVPGRRNRLGETEGAELDHVVVATEPLARLAPPESRLDWLRTVVAHEVGHVLMRSGEHSEDPACVMQTGKRPLLDGVVGATACDAAMLEAAYPR